MTALNALDTASVGHYRALVQSLMEQHPLDEAMSLAVGGNYNQIGRIEREILKWAGAPNDGFVADIGCGSGRLAKALLEDNFHGLYLGTDVVPELIEYAETHYSGNFNFKLIEKLYIPLKNAEADFIAFFSVFTHLLLEESFIYLEEAKRVLKPKGRIIFSFLDLGVETHWLQFEHTVQTLSSRKQLNTFFGRPEIEAIANHLNLRIIEICDGDTFAVPIPNDIIFDDGTIASKEAGLGQSIALLEAT